MVEETFVLFCNQLIAPPCGETWNVCAKPQLSPGSAWCQKRKAAFCGLSGEIHLSLDEIILEGMHAGIHLSSVNTLHEVFGHNIMHMETDQIRWIAVRRESWNRYSCVLVSWLVSHVRMWSVILFIMERFLHVACSSSGVIEWRWSSKACNEWQCCISTCRSDGQLEAIRPWCLHDN